LPKVHASLQEQARVEVLVGMFTVEVGRPRVEDGKVQLMSHHICWLAVTALRVGTGLMQRVSIDTPPVRQRITGAMT